MEKKNRIVKADITSWIGLSIGARHYYLKMCYYDIKGEYQADRIDVILTSKQAKELNIRERENGSDHKYYKGDEIDGFETEELAEKKAIEIFRNKLKTHDVLLRGSWGIATTSRCLDAKHKNIINKINKLYKRAVEIDFYENDVDEMDELDKKYWRILNEL